MKGFLLLACTMILAGSASAEEGPVYQRHRQHGGGYGDHHGGGFYGGGYYGQPFYGGYYYQPPIYGSWYARPYPTHLDYFRLRGTPRPDCPCADMIPALQQEVPAE